MKTATKKASKKTAPKHAEPSADASPRHKALVAAARRRGAPPAAPETAPATEPAPTPQEAPGPAPEASAADDAPSRDAAAATFESREPATPPAWFPTDARPDAPFARLADLGATWLAYLAANGARPTTVDGYGRDLAIAYEYFGEDCEPDRITAATVADFEASPGVNRKRNGAPRAKASILRTRRVLRLALKWAHGAGRLAASPYAA